MPAAYMDSVSAEPDLLDDSAESCDPPLGPTPGPSPPNLNTLNSGKASRLEFPEKSMN
ncbi:hypothetical protein PtA15_12A70 [Puccinia triticina]|uniref:Uncharacterized protein n=1 Tax=Puccinia triticina TaxID=208348 RepID=A0ABY7CYR0_9BASI|nr:uncharacterized protein PtA15_12A70 [Puccinia triticina]WAQ90085.1 hypothetical protein PtA15_12A70 [Puccinia triticina]